MRITLRSLFLALAVLAAAALTTQTASAASVRVPFNFEINGKTLPAGTYSVNRDLNGSFVILESEDCKIAYTWYALRGDSIPSDHNVILRFDEYGSEYALQSVQFNSLITPRLDKQFYKKHSGERATMHTVQGQ
ncbi:MAG TPA: hypothetical protein VF742_01555 [Terracidiphilus sp.]|jgi:hypothetical protein